MKTFYAAASTLVILLLGFSSCQKDTTTIPAYLQMPALTGKWNLTEFYKVTSTDAGTTTSTPVTSFTTDDFFEFKANNAATYSSTILGKSYNGYYSANSTTTPVTLTFKSGTFLNRYSVGEFSKTRLVLYQTKTTTVAGASTTVADYYVYTH